MRLAGVRAGDVVRGYAFWALVERPDSDELEIAPLCRGVGYRLVRARHVVAHYRRSGASLK